MAEIILVILVALTAYIFTQQGSGSFSLSSLNPFNLSASQIAQYAQNAGFSGDALITAVAIALAESSGNASAYNPETQAGTPEGMGSYGLWQIYLNAHPEFQGVDLTDPQNNANAAFEIFSTNGFAPWSTYQSRAYQSYLTDATNGVNA